MNTQELCPYPPLPSDKVQPNEVVLFCMKSHKVPWLPWNNDDTYTLIANRKRFTTTETYEGTVIGVLVGNGRDAFLLSIIAMNQEILIPCFAEEIVR